MTNDDSPGGERLPNAPAVPGPAGGAASSPPPGGRFPVWGWVLIGVGAFLLVVVVVLAIVFATFVGRLGSAASDGGSLGRPPAASPAPSPDDGSGDDGSNDESADDGSAGQSAGDIPLDESFAIGSGVPAIWSLPVLDGWEITTFDQEGVNILTNAGLSCMFTTSQNRQVPADATVEGDRTESETTLQVVEESFLAQAPDAVVVDSPTLAIPYGVQGADQSAEFLGARIDYVRADTGEPYTSLFALRAMPRLEGMMYTVLNCPTATIDGDATIWEGLLSQTAVVSGG